MCTEEKRGGRLTGNRITRLINSRMNSTLRLPFQHRVRWKLLLSSTILLSAHYRTLYTVQTSLEQNKYKHAGTILLATATR